MLPTVPFHQSQDRVELQRESYDRIATETRLGNRYESLWSHILRRPSSDDNKGVLLQQQQVVVTEDRINLCSSDIVAVLILYRNLGEAMRVLAASHRRRIRERVACRLADGDDAPHASSLQASDEGTASKPRLRCNLPLLSWWQEQWESTEPLAGPVRAGHGAATGTAAGTDSPSCSRIDADAPAVHSADLQTLLHASAPHEPLVQSLVALGRKGITRSAQQLELLLRPRPAILGEMDCLRAVRGAQHGGVLRGGGPEIEGHAKSAGTPPAESEARPAIAKSEASPAIAAAGASGRTDGAAPPEQLPIEHIEVSVKFLLFLPKHSTGYSTDAAGYPTFADEARTGVPAAGGSSDRRGVQPMQAPDRRPSAALVRLRYALRSVVDSSGPAISKPSHDVQMLCTDQLNGAYVAMRTLLEGVLKLKHDSVRSPTTAVPADRDLSRVQPASAVPGRTFMGWGREVEAGLRALFPACRAEGLEPDESLSRVPSSKSASVDPESSREEPHPSYTEVESRSASADGMDPVPEVLRRWVGPHGHENLQRKLRKAQEQLALPRLPAAQRKIKELFGPRAAVRSSRFILYGWLFYPAESCLDGFQENLGKSKPAGSRPASGGSHVVWRAIESPPRKRLSGDLGYTPLDTQYRWYLDQEACARVEARLQQLSNETGGSRSDRAVPVTESVPEGRVPHVFDWTSSLLAPSIGSDGRITAPAMPRAARGLSDAAVRRQSSAGSACATALPSLPAPISPTHATGWHTSDPLALVQSRPHSGWVVLVKPHWMAPAMVPVHASILVDAAPDPSAPARGSGVAARGYLRVATSPKPEAGLAAEWAGWDADIDLLDRRSRRIWWANEFPVEAAQAPDTVCSPTIHAPGSDQSAAGSHAGLSSSAAAQPAPPSGTWSRIEVLTGAALLRLLRRHYAAAAAEARWQSQRLLVAEVQLRVSDGSRDTAGTKEEVCLSSRERFDGDGGGGESKSSMRAGGASGLPVRLGMDVPGMPGTAVQYLKCGTAGGESDLSDPAACGSTRTLGEGREMCWREVSRGFVLEPGWEQFSRESQGLVE